MWTTRDTLPPDEECELPPPPLGTPTTPSTPSTPTVAAGGRERLGQAFAGNPAPPKFLEARTPDAVTRRAFLNLLSSCLTIRGRSWRGSAEIADVAAVLSATVSSLRFSSLQKHGREAKGRDGPRGDRDSKESQLSGRWVPARTPPGPHQPLPRGEIAAPGPGGRRAKGDPVPAGVARAADQSGCGSFTTAENLHWCREQRPPLLLPPGRRCPRRRPSTPSAAPGVPAARRVPAQTRGPEPSQPPPPTGAGPEPGQREVPSSSLLWTGEPGQPKVTLGVSHPRADRAQAGPACAVFQLPSESALLLNS